MRLAYTVGTLALLVFAFGCPDTRNERQAPEPARPRVAASSPNPEGWAQAIAALPDLAPVRPEPEVLHALERARAEFEVLAVGYTGTAKLYPRAAFFPLDDQRARSEGEFLGRLRAIFGVTAEDEYVLRHRATGLIVTAYSAQSGPAYGGSIRLDVDRSALIAADPILARGRPVDWAQVPIPTTPDAVMLRLRTVEHAWHRRMYDVLAGSDYARVIARLEALIGSVPPVDFEVTRTDADDGTSYRIGVRHGAAFEEEAR